MSHDDQAASQEQKQAAALAKALKGVKHEFRILQFMHDKDDSGTDGDFGLKVFFAATLYLDNGQWARRNNYLVRPESKQLYATVMEFSTKGAMCLAKVKRVEKAGLVCLIETCEQFKNADDVKMAAAK